MTADRLLILMVSIPVALVLWGRAVPARSDAEWAALMTRPGRSAVDRRLQRGLMPVDRAGWRWRSAAAACVIGAVLFAAGVSPVGASLSAVTITRVIGGVVLRSRAHRLAAECDRAQCELARRVATELAAGCGVLAALTRMAGEPPASRLARMVLCRAVAATSAGLPLAAALDRAAACAAADTSGGGRLRQTLRVIEFAGRGADAGALTLRRYAEGAEAEQRSRRELAAAGAEARFVACALPVVTVVMGTVITTLGPRGALALSPLSAAVTAIAMAVAVAGAGTVVLATRP